MNHTTDETPIKDKLYKERVSLLYRQTSFTLLANVINSVIAALILWDEVRHSSLLFWVFCVFVITGLRYLAASMFKNALLTTENAWKWKTFYMAGATAAGLAWGAAGFFLMPAESFMHQVFLTFVLGGMVLGALAAHAVVLEVYLAYLSAVLVPLAARLFMFGDDIHIAMGTLVVIYITVMTFVASRFYQAAVDSLRLRFENIYLNDLLESKKRIEAITSSANDAIIMVDNDSRVVFWNPAAENIFGYSFDEAEGKKLSGLVIPPKYRERHDNGFRSFRETGEGPVVGGKAELEGLRKSGETFPIELSVSAIRLGDHWHAIGTVRDITERKKAEQELKESERTYATLLSNLPGMVYRCENDENRTMEFISDGCEPLTGYNSSELLHNSVVSYAELIHPADRPMVWEKVQEALEDGVQFQLQYRIITAGGGEKWVWEKGAGIYSGDGALLSMEGFISDITEHVEAEELVRYRLKIEEALATISGLFFSDRRPDFNILIRTLGETVSASRSCVLMLEDGASSMRKTHEWLAPGAVFDAHIPDVMDASRFDWMINRLEKDGGLVIDDVGNMPPEAKREKHFLRALNISSLAAVPILTGADRMEGIMGFDDVREPRAWAEGDIRMLRVASAMIANYLKRKRSEEALRQSNARLKNAMYDLERTQSMLLRSEKLASLGKLSAGVAHEIKNPLNIISSSVQLLMMEEDVSPDTAQSYATILEQVARAVRITDNLRDFARERKPQKKSIDLLEFMNKTIALVEYEMRTENIEVKREFAAGRINILGDPDQLAQVFLNIISNARDSMNEKQSVFSYETLAENGWEGRLTIGARVIGPWVHITFDDTGVGMSEEVIGRIFDPFFTTKEENKGTGLGMSIAYGIIENHGGHIEASSKNGSGARLSVILPLPEHNISI